MLAALDYFIPPCFLDGDLKSLEAVAGGERFVESLLQLPQEGGSWAERCTDGEGLGSPSRMSGEADLLTRDLSKMSDEEVLAYTKEDLVQKLRKEEAEKITALIQRGRLIKEVNKQLQEHLTEIRELKQVNHRLQEENQELRELCCFLDDDRLKVKTLSREWQLFGHHAAKVMRDDLGGYLKKLGELERLQGELVKENVELKQLCLVLEEECVSRGSEASPIGSSELSLPCGPRDLGDGSSSTGSVGSPDPLHLACSPDD